MTVKLYFELCQLQFPTVVIPIQTESNPNYVTCVRLGPSVGGAHLYSHGMKNLSIRVIIGILFSVVGLVSLFFSSDALMAAIWLSFGNGLILSDLRLTGVDEQGNQFVKPIPRVRTYVAIMLIVFAVLLLLLQIFMDTQQVGGGTAQ